MRALANAMRDISTSEVFLRQKIYAWMENKVNSFNANDYRSYISTAYYSLGMPGVEYDYTSLKRQGLADEIFNPRQDPMQIEHFLEVHFAGPILVAAINAGIVQGDETLLTTLSLLRLIFNHQANLAWAPPNSTD
ncbi:hypothetical protein N7462_004334 [Penicillium macrosclerotiorum]|uniref:uncharacterized protein n=1 Tax=Penicillium macrosclerotiorum TaxID=303699 RepID=UPI002548103A|nr:uncharacterized protein N7462_004334 [Penicillium macrosclerotiorum]KAJ5689942.1 hypothetical protein N7462_004334 [Penicillium macrosclerotiorum]